MLAHLNNQCYQTLSNFRQWPSGDHQEATNFRREATNFRREATNFRREATDRYYFQPPRFVRSYPSPQHPDIQNITNSVKGMISQVFSLNLYYIIGDISKKNGISMF